MTMRLQIAKRLPSRDFRRKGNARPWQLWMLTGVLGRHFIAAYATEEAAREAARKLQEGA
jgi:hypothetical protein